MPLSDSNWFLQSDLRLIIHELSGRKLKEQEAKSHRIFAENAGQRISSRVFFDAISPGVLFCIRLMLK